jgi:hypothetical protein
MRTSILTIALALATLPLTFAAKAPASTATKPASSTKTFMKHHKKSAAKKSAHKNVKTGAMK